jgi:hypothetical protein
MYNNNGKDPAVDVFIVSIWKCLLLYEYLITLTRLLDSISRNTEQDSYELGQLSKGGPHSLITTEYGWVQ